MGSNQAQLLIGNTFPLTLIRRAVNITPQSLDNLCAALATSEVHSFWGHIDTLEIASTTVGADLAPRCGIGNRPALALSIKQDFPSRT